MKSELLGFTLFLGFLLVAADRVAGSQVVQSGIDHARYYYVVASLHRGMSRTDVRALLRRAQATTGARETRDGSLGVTFTWGPGFTTCPERRLTIRFSGRAVASWRAADGTAWCV